MKIAIIHYWLVNMRGGEKMLESLLELFPGADIYTHVYNPAAVSTLIAGHRIFKSRINNLPFSKKLYRLYMPLMPKALLDFNLQNYDIIISSEAGPAKGIIPNPNAYHLCYCHSPMRYLWDMYHEYYKNANIFTRFFMKNLIPSLRIWDITSSNLVDRFVTNSNYTAKRIMRIYNREAAVIYGPVQITKYLNIGRNPSDYYLVFGEITSYKRIDIALEACIESKRKLIVAGAGIKKSDLNKYSKNDHIIFKGRVSDEEAAELYSKALALLYPGIEDLGLIPIEANAAGCPVIAYRDGGALDTIKENVTGIFFNEQSTGSLIEAMDRFENALLSGAFKEREPFSNHVKQFSSESFKDRVKRIIAEKRRV
jgi:glycosyltransferase involved in cell wall biosynthesis